MNVLPTGWKIIRFNEFLTRVNRKIEVDDSISYKCVGVRWYGKGAFIREAVPGFNIKRKQQWIIKKDDIVYNKLFAWKGSFAIADASIDDCIVSDKFPTYIANPERIDSRFLSFYFSMPQVADQAQFLSKGGAAISKLTLNPPQFWELTIPLPLLEEQRRIVVLVERLTSKIEVTLRYRQQATCEAAGLIDSAISQIIDQDTNNPSWEVGPIPMFAEVNPSRKGQINLDPGDRVSFVPMKAVDAITGTIAWPETRSFAEVGKGYTWFKEDDVIFARITPCMQNGKAAIAQNLVAGTAFGSTEFHVIRPGPKVKAEWLHMLVRHKPFRDDAANHFKGTAGQQRVPQRFLEQKVISVPPLIEQQRILTYLQSLGNKVKELERLQTETAAELDALLPSILDWAFKGEL